MKYSVITMNNEMQVKRVLFFNKRNRIKIMKKTTENKMVEFDQVMDNAISRRHFLRGGAIIFGASNFVISTGIAALTSKQAITHSYSQTSLLEFTEIASNTLDTVTVPKGFGWYTVMSWGDPLWSDGKSFNHTTGDAKSQALSFGDNNDGMDIFTRDGRTILAVNNEYVNNLSMYHNRDSKLAENLDDVMKAKQAHGVSIVELERKNNKYSIVKDSLYNRKITADTPIEITGPAKAHQLMKTKKDPTGTKSLGTWNNCGNGKTPWGTYLSCEENFNGYFSSSDKNLKLSKEFKRYGIKHEDSKKYAWGKYDERFDIALNPTEPNRAGYVVEIDPLNPKYTPKKRTALGRFKHENAEVVIAKNGHVVVYLGDDERGEYLYKFVSADKYSKYGNNSNLLEDGDLFVAKFNDNNTGIWLALTPETTGMSKAKICIYTRLAASKVGATTMDRPEWVAANPNKSEVYCALTNNKNRGIKPNKDGDATPINAVNPRMANKYGQIVRWMPKNSDHSDINFSWNLFALAGNPEVHKNDLKSGSENITKHNMFNSPDGLKFDSKGGLWIQTDGKYSNQGDFAGMGNNQMLLGDPNTGEIKRFLVGPKECEITGLTWSADKETMFVGIQHPGEKGNSHFPDKYGNVPRSSIVAIYRKDGGTIG